MSVKGLVANTYLFPQSARGATRSLERRNRCGYDHLETRRDGLPDVDLLLPAPVDESELL